MAGEGTAAIARKHYSSEVTAKVLFTCMIAATGGMIYGYDVGISGGVTSMDPFLEKFFPAVYRKETSMLPSDNKYCKFNSQVLTLFTSSLYLSALFSSFVASFITRVLGRRTTMLCGGFLFFVGALFNCIAQSISMLIVGRILLGFGVGCNNQSVPIYLSETAPYKARGALNMMFQLSITIGILSSNVLNYFFAKIEGGWGWRLSLGGGMIPALLLIIGSFFLADTPNYLIEREKYEEAKARLIKLRGTDDVDEEFNDLVAAHNASKLVKHPFRSLLKRKYRPQLTFAFLIPFFQQFTGINIITFYAPILFRTIGLGSSASLFSAVIIGVVKVSCTFVSILVVDRAGRRFLFMEGGAQMLFSQVVITIAIALKFGVDGHPGEIQKWYAVIMVFFICLYVAAFAWSWGPLGWLVPSEIFPLEVRSAAQSINVSVNMFSTFLVAQFFTTMLCHLRFGLFIFYAVFVTIMTCFVYKFLPETKGVPMEEMTIIWQKHPFWRKFVDVDGAKTGQNA